MKEERGLTSFVSADVLTLLFFFFLTFYSLHLASCVPACLKKKRNEMLKSTTLILLCLCWNRISLGAAMPACLSSWHVPDFICESGLVLCTSLLMWVDLFCSTMAAVGLWKRSAVALSTGGNLFCFLQRIKPKPVFVSSSADRVPALRTQDEEELLRCQGPLQIPPQLPGTTTYMHNETTTKLCW